MSDIRFNRWLHQSGTGGVFQDSSGRVGIGTSLPTSALDVQSGTIKIGTNTLSSSGVSTFTNLVVSAGSTSAPSISPSGDSNTGIFFPSADTVAIGEGGVESARFDSSGRFGLGTQNPSTTLHVLGGTASGAFTINYNLRLSTGTTGSQAFSGVGNGIYFDSFTNSGTQPVAAVSSALDSGGSGGSSTNYSGHLLFYTKSVTDSSPVERARIDSSGRVTAPSQPSFSAYLSTNQNISSATWTQVSLNTTRFNIGNNFSTSTNTFTAPVAGRYLFSYTVNFNLDTALVSSGSYLYSAIKINGSFYHYGQGFRNSVIWKNDCTLSATQIVNLSANDAITFWAFSDGANILASGLERTHLAGYLLS